MCVVPVVFDARGEVEGLHVIDVKFGDEVGMFCIAVADNSNVDDRTSVDMLEECDSTVVV